MLVASEECIRQNQVQVRFTHHDRQSQIWHFCTPSPSPTYLHLCQKNPMPDTRIPSTSTNVYINETTKKNLVSHRIYFAVHEVTQHLPAPGGFSKVHPCIWKKYHVWDRIPASHITSKSPNSAILRFFWEPTLWSSSAKNGTIQSGNIHHRTQQHTRLQP